MNQKLKSVLQFAIFLSLGLGLMYFAFINLDLDYDKVINGFKSANYFWIVAALAVSLLSHFVRAIRWNLLFEPMGLKAKNVNAFNAVMIGYLFNFAIPRMGEVSRCGILLRTDKIPMDKSLGTVVVERIFDMIVLLILTIAVLLLQFNLLFGFFNDTFFQPVLQKLQSVSFGMVIMLTALLLVALLGLIISRKKLLQSKLVVKIITIFKGFGEGFKSVFKLKQPGMFLFHTLLIWILYFLNTFCFLHAFEATSSLGVLSTLIILVVGTFGFAAPVSGGIGAYHILVAKGLALYGITSVAGGVFGFVSHGMQMIMILIVGSFSLLYTIIAERKVLANG